MVLHSCLCVTCCAVTKISPPCSCERVASKFSFRENDSLRDVWRAVFRASNSTFLRPFKICYVSHAFGDTCARNDSVRNVWRASCRFRAGVLSSPIYWPSLRRRPRKRILGKRDHNLAVSSLVAASLPHARSHPRR